MQINSSLPQLPIMKVQNLNVYRGQYLALHDVSFQLKPGTDTAIVGPNGAGKSTLIQAILGLLKIQSGKIEIFGRKPEQLGLWSHQIGYIPQNFIFDRNFPISVEELVGLGWVNIHGKPWEINKNIRQKKAAVNQALVRVKAEHIKHQPIGTLSGGELKRVLLAYCLVMPRQLLILDEAFAGIDMQGSAEFYQLLYELKNTENWTVLQISHDIDMVSKYCDHVLCLNRTIICEGHPEHTLSEQNLTATYGLSFTRYHHHHGD